MSQCRSLTTMGVGWNHTSSHHENSDGISMVGIGGMMTKWPKISGEWYTAWWFGTFFFIFPNSWDDDPIWLLYIILYSFFKMVKTTNHIQPDVSRMLRDLILFSGWSKPSWMGEISLPSAASALPRFRLDRGRSEGAFFTPCEARMLLSCLRNRARAAEFIQ